MALTSLGRNVVASEALKELGPVDGKTSKEVRDAANAQLADARKGLLDSLTPWIPGDYLVTYGVLLTAWEAVRASFAWMIVVAAASALVFVVLGAFSTTGFRGRRSPNLKKQLTIRTVVGFLVSLYAAIAIPQSGWYTFSWFRDNELACVVTAGVIVVALVMLLKGFQKRLGWTLGSS